MTGRDVALDVQIAEKVFGEIPCDNWSMLAPFAGMMMGEPHCTHDCYPRLSGPAHFSSNMAAAWHLVERIAPLGGDFFLDGLGYREVGDVVEGLWRCWFTTDRDDFRETWIGEAKTAPMAICIAALRWKGVEIEGSDHHKPVSQKQEIQP